MSEPTHSSPIERAEKFVNRLGIRIPILLAPMAGACPPSLSIAVANAGGLGGCGALMMKPDEIRSWGMNSAEAAREKSRLISGFRIQHRRGILSWNDRKGNFWRSGDPRYRLNRATRNCLTLKRSARRC